jgi:hypothetical protein
VSAIQLPDDPASKNQNTNMKNDIKKTGAGTKNAQSALADINTKIAELQQQRVGLAEPLKIRYAELRNELAAMETEIRSLDGNWKPEPMKPKAETKIAEVITAHGSPMTADEIVATVGDVFTPWKVRNTLKKKSIGAKAVFSVNDGKFSLKAA